jgi:2-polyprenyl-3-methyl-5-hydroxy-6-metoxy-1,4-benzoquinol methylase
VFACTEEETGKVKELRDTLEMLLQSGSQIPALWLIAAAAYFPLFTLASASSLLDRRWPDAVAAVLAQQIREPAEEVQLRLTIPRLTSIDDEVSRLVQDQYEENPYPRWVKLPPVGEARNIVGYLCQKFPLANFDRHGNSGSIDLLIAGCGTGQHSIGTALRTKGAKMLAVDLSLSSLSYAKRKTQELGITSIEYAQADILKLGSMDRRFDVIESSGVLHHLADPWSGWQVLLSLLRPRGFMKIGLYSETARSDIIRIRTFIAENDYGSTADEIRQCRQDLMALDITSDFGTVLKSPDFFSISACRDLLFHVQEHCMTLSGIEVFLGRNNLQFLGFEIDASVIQAYRRRFPEDQAAINLKQWKKFEEEHPDTFSNMYQFWIQKRN